MCITDDRVPKVNLVAFTQFRKGNTNSYSEINYLVILSYEHRH